MSDNAKLIERLRARYERAAGTDPMLAQAANALEAAEAKLTRRDTAIATAEPRDLGYGVRWCKVCETAQPLYVMGYMVEHRKTDQSVCGGSHWVGDPLPESAAPASLESDQGSANERLHPTPEENFWDDRTTPLAYSQEDSERDLEARRQIAEKAWDEGWAARANGDPVTQNPFRKKE